MNTKKIIAIGIVAGWVLYSLAVFIAQNTLENRIKEVQIFDKLFENDPALAATIKHEFETKSFTSLKGVNNDGFSIMSWRILQNLEVISEQDRPNQVSSFVNGSLGSIVKSNGLIELNEMSGLELIYKILTGVGKKPHIDNQEAITLEFLKASMAGSPMSYREYVYFAQYHEDLSVWFRKFLAYVLPPELSSSFWEEAQLGEVLALSYKHLGVGAEFEQMDQRDGKLEMLTAYNQFNDLVLKLMIMVYNDEAVVAARDRLMIFKGLVQCLILMTFCVTLLVILFLDFTTEKNDRLLDLLKTMLPTLGFIGTILGLMRSLGSAYKIPIASGNANTSLAISEITTSLSIAFTTTLLAFVLLIIVDVVRVYKLKNA